MPASHSPKSPIAAAVSAIKPALIAVMAFSFAINVLVFIPSIYSLQVYDRVMTSRSETTLLMLSLIVLALLAAYAALEHLRAKILTQAGIRFNALLAGPAFDAALISALRLRGSHHVQTIRDVDAMRDFVSTSGFITLMDLPWTPVFLIVTFLFHPLIGLVTLLGAASLLVIALLNERLTKSALVESALLNLAALEQLSACLRNAEAIRGLGMAEGVRRRWAASYDTAIARAIAASDRGGVLQALAKFIRLALQVAVLGVGAILAIHQEISAGVMFAAALIMGRALAPIEMAVAQWRAFVTARAAHQRLTAVFAQMPAETGRMALPRPTGILTVEHLTVVAPDGRTPLVRNAHFGLAKGEILALIGPTGSGKSSLARALVGAGLVAQGAIRLDGNDISHYDPLTLGAALGYLPQDVELFAGAIADNICRFGTRDDAAILAAARMAHAHDLIQHLPQGYETVLGENGEGLSGGQRQRIGLARALYGDPALVVLDEPNSNLDGDGDAALAQAILDMKGRGATVILITHKPSLLTIVDRIAIMQAGEIRRFSARDEVLPLLMGGNVGALAGSRAA